MAVLGIELGSTRIKGVLSGPNGSVLATGVYGWENQLENGVWVYHLDEAWVGLASVIAQVKAAAPEEEPVEGLGFSGMMHGYLVFDKSGKQLAPFRTWRNTITEEAAALLSQALSFNIPQRWSAAHLYQAILNGEEHVRDVDYITTLAGYVHWMLTGQRCVGVGDASGMFPIGEDGGGFDTTMLGVIEKMAAEKGVRLSLPAILPRVLHAGADAGRLTERGAVMLDPTGWLKPGTPLCPPEGNAGTGMVATGSVAPLTGNVSAGTSIFALIVLEKPLAGCYPEIDVVTTPTGTPVAMVHCNNCTTDLDAWFGLFGQALAAFGATVEKPLLYDIMCEEALKAEPDAGGLVSYNYYSGEPISKTDAGVPLFMRRADSVFSLPNFCRSLLFSCMATLKMGMDILLEKEQVRLQSLQGHGGLFKTKVVGARFLASVLGAPVSVSATAGEGGARGIAILAGYRVWRMPGETLESYLNTRVFAGGTGSCEEPNAEDAEGFGRYMEMYKKGIEAERAAAAAFATMENTGL